MSNRKEGSVLSGMFWMFLISLLLFWLPLFGPLLAGIVGGKKAGGVGPAILAVFLPGIILAALLFLFGSSLTGLPLIGAIFSAGGLYLYISNIGFLLVGAIIGGVIS